MSLAGTAQVHGSRATWYRPSGYTRTDDGGRKVTSWTALETDVALRIEPITFELVQKVFGASDLVRDRGYVPGDRGFQPGDALVITAGSRSGRKYRVETPLLYPGNLRTAHAELALVETTETIP